MRKSLIIPFLFALALTACSNSGRETAERIKMTQPAPAKGQTADAWDIVHDSWAGDADRDLVRDARQALAEDPETVAFAEAVGIESAGGSIVLRGSGAYTLNMQEWQTVGRRVKAVRGVKAVEIKSRVSAED